MRGAGLAVVVVVMLVAVVDATPPELGPYNIGVKLPVAPVVGEWVTIFGNVSNYDRKPLSFGVRTSPGVEITGDLFWNLTGSEKGEQSRTWEVRPTVSGPWSVAVGPSGIRAWAAQNDAGRLDRDMRPAVVKSTMRATILENGTIEIIKTLEPAWPGLDVRACMYAPGHGEIPLSRRQGPLNVSEDLVLALPPRALGQFEVYEAVIARFPVDPLADDEPNNEEVMLASYRVYEQTRSSVVEITSRDGSEDWMRDECALYDAVEAQVIEDRRLPPEIPRGPDPVTASSEVPLPNAIAFASAVAAVALLYRRRA